MNNYFFITKGELDNVAPQIVQNNYPHYDENFDLVSCSWRDLIEAKSFSYQIHSNDYNSKGLPNSQKHILLKGNFGNEGISKEEALGRFDEYNFSL